MIKFNFSLTLHAFSIISCSVISSSLPDWYDNEEQFVTLDTFMISKNMDIWGRQEQFEEIQK